MTQTTNLNDNPFFKLGAMMGDNHDKIIKLKKALDHALYNMSRDQQATMSDPTYEEAMELLK